MRAGAVRTSCWVRGLFHEHLDGVEAAVEGVGYVVLVGALLEGGELALAPYEGFPVNGGCAELHPE